MPYKSLRVCTYPGCNSLVEAGRCPVHPYARNYDREREAKRKKEYEGRAFYESADWRALRREHMRREPYCRICRERDLVLNPGAEVDHITPISEGGEPLSRFNLQTLCKRHHTQKTVAERTARARRQRRADERRRMAGHKPRKQP